MRGELIFRSSASVAFEPSMACTCQPDFFARSSSCRDSFSVPGRFGREIDCRSRISTERSATSFVFSTGLIALFKAKSGFAKTRIDVFAFARGFVSLNRATIARDLTATAAEFGRYLFNRFCRQTSRVAVLASSGLFLLSLWPAGRREIDFGARAAAPSHFRIDQSANPLTTMGNADDPKDYQRPAKKKPQTPPSIFSLSFFFILLFHFCGGGAGGFFSPPPSFPPN